MKVVVLATYLRMSEPRQASLAFPEIAAFKLRTAQKQDAAIIQALYKEVGVDHLWTARSNWHTIQFEDRIAEEGVQFWIAELSGVPAGFAEIACADNQSVQIVFLAVRKTLAGRGIGKHLLSTAIQEAWKRKPKQVWLQTTSYDGEYALSNYLKRGFAIFKARPRVISVPQHMKSAAMQAVFRAREHGSYPPPLRRIEGHLRSSRPGQAAAYLLYKLRRRLRRNVPVEIYRDAGL